MNNICKQAVNQLIIHRRSSRNRYLGFAVDIFMLRRDGRRDNQPVMFGFRLQHVFKVLRGTFHNGIIFFQESFVTCEKVMLPKVLAKPGIPGWPKPPKWPVYYTCDSPYIGI